MTRKILRLTPFAFPHVAFVLVVGLTGACSMDDTAAPSQTTAGSTQSSTQSGAAGSGTSASSTITSGVGGSVGTGGSNGLAGSGGNDSVPDAAQGSDTGAQADVGTSASDAPTSTGDARGGGSGDGGACPGLFCEDFESGQVDTAKWSMQTAGGATAVVQQKIVAHGKYAAQFHGLPMPTGASQAYAYFITKGAPAALQTHNFGRAYFYVAPKQTSIDTGLIFGGTTGFPKPTYMSIASHSGGWQLGFIKLQGSPGGEVQAYPKGVQPVATWTCLEWEFNDQPDTNTTWVDGQLLGSLDPNHLDYPPGHTPGTPLYNGMSSGLIGAFTDFGFGFYDWHPSGFAFDVYYDDIVLDTKRVGCL